MGKRPKHGWIPHGDVLIIPVGMLYMVLYKCILPQVAVELFYGDFSEYVSGIVQGVLPVVTYGSSFGSASGLVLRWRVWRSFSVDLAVSGKMR